MTNIMTRHEDWNIGDWKIGGWERWVCVDGERLEGIKKESGKGDWRGRGNMGHYEELGRLNYWR